VSEEAPEHHHENALEDDPKDALPASAIQETQAESEDSTFLTNLLKLPQANSLCFQLPRANKLCPSCGETEAVFFQSQQRSAETGMVR
jgi:DNA-directed RNA polymerase subunit M/transcription elongation factor TFIIS